MEYAKELVQKKMGTITEISYLLGYEKPSQFIKMFKKHYGVNPGISRQVKVLSS